MKPRFYTLYLASSDARKVRKIRVSSYAIQVLAVLAQAGVVRRVPGRAGGGPWWVARGGDAWRLAPERPRVRDHSRSVAAGGEVTSPMPGTVLAVHVEPGQSVGTGDRLVVVEAMKMEHVVTAPAPGTVVEVLVEPGQSVRLDQPLIVVTAEEDG